MKHRNFETRAELLRAAADSIEMQEKAGIEPVCKCAGDTANIANMIFAYVSYGYEFPLAVVEGRPVWEGDELYAEGSKETMVAGAGNALGWKHGCNICFVPLKHCSWNPPTPTPKTVMVELTVEQAVALADTNYWGLGLACLRALEGLK